ncbi:hypothetical protein P4H42_06860 [Paenibacillus macerans]|uniref:hypothetical protein n=1 Tax=Paenibacillus macerans TaxID=44252 RepID=UPI002DBB103A|nr:hypothetical protein [Paenibacillus macerans]MEC0329344.1 hypothetical protein [Paenibacillus macerans]
MSENANNTVGTAGKDIAEKMNSQDCRREEILKNSPWNQEDQSFNGKVSKNV